MGPLLAEAIIRVPSADSATETQLLDGTLACVQTVPKLVEMKIGPLTAVAAKIVPLVDIATDDQQLVADTFACCQVAPEFVDRQTGPLLATTASLLQSADEATEIQW
jgi:hypothetical protein